MNQQTTVVARATIGVLLAWTAYAEDTPPPQLQTPGDHERSITVDGMERRYVVHVPAGYDGNTGVPVVMMFHGGGGTARAAMWETGWAERADQERFLAVFPEGTPRDASRPASFIGNPQTWNDGSKRTNLGAVVQGVQDVEFVAAMLSDLKEQFNVDPRRIYATGFSNGASMAFRLARELSTVVAAVAPVAGGDWLENGKPDRAVPLMYVTGTADPLNPLEGGEIHIGPKYFGTKPPTDEMIGKWVKLHGCPEEPQTVRYENGVRRVAYGRSGEQNVVVLYMVDGHGHHWPGGRSRLPERLVGENTSKLKATHAIWEFFKEHSLAVVPGSSR